MCTRSEWRELDAAEIVALEPPVAPSAASQVGRSPGTGLGLQGNAIVQYCNFEDFDTAIEGDGAIQVRRSSFSNVGTLVAAENSRISMKGIKRS